MESVTQFLWEILEHASWSGWIGLQVYLLSKCDDCGTMVTPLPFLLDSTLGSFMVGAGEMNLPCVKCSSRRLMEAPRSVISSGSLGIVNVMQHTYHTPRLRDLDPALSCIHTAHHGWFVSYILS